MHLGTREGNKLLLIVHGKGPFICRFAFLRGTEWEEEKGKVTYVFTIITGWSFGNELKNLFSINLLAHYLCVDILNLLSEKQGQF